MRRKMMLLHQSMKGNRGSRTIYWAAQTSEDCSPLRRHTVKFPTNYWHVAPLLLDAVPANALLTLYVLIMFLHPYLVVKLSPRTRTCLRLWSKPKNVPITSWIKRPQCIFWTYNMFWIVDLKVSGCRDGSAAKAFGLFFVSSVSIRKVQ